MLQTYGEAFRTPPLPRAAAAHDGNESSDESMNEEETPEQRYAWYARDEMCEVSDPEYWTEVHYGRSKDG